MSCIFITVSASVQTHTKPHQNQKLGLMEMRTSRGPRTSTCIDSRDGMHGAVASCQSFQWYRSLMTVEAVATKGPFIKLQVTRTMGPAPSCTHGCFTVQWSRRLERPRAAGPRSQQLPTTVKTTTVQNGQREHRHGNTERGRRRHQASNSEPSKHFLSELNCKVTDFYFI